MDLASRGSFMNSINAKTMTDRMRSVNTSVAATKDTTKQKNKEITDIDEIMQESDGSRKQTAMFHAAAEQAADQTISAQLEHDSQVDDQQSQLLTLGPTPEPLETHQNESSRYLGEGTMKVDDRAD